MSTTPPTKLCSVRNQTRILTCTVAPTSWSQKGLKRSAFADFDVAFRHALRGIHGPDEDRELLVFLAAYLQTALARFFLFHTSSNWGVSRAEVHVEELLRLPFPARSGARPQAMPQHRARSCPDYCRGCEPNAGRRSSAGMTSSLKLLQPLKSLSRNTSMWTTSNACSLQTPILSLFTVFGRHEHVSIFPPSNRQIIQRAAYTISCVIR